LRHNKPSILKQDTKEFRTLHINCYSKVYFILLFCKFISVKIWQNVLPANPESPRGHYQSLKGQVGEGRSVGEVRAALRMTRISIAKIPENHSRE
jgi:hypothetical protein